MANLLSDAKKQQVIALGQLGWTLRRIEAATGVRRETAGGLPQGRRARRAARRTLGPPAKTGQRGVHRLRAAYSLPGPSQVAQLAQPPRVGRGSKPPQVPARDCESYVRVAGSMCLRGMRVGCSRGTLG